ncbi:hypothetical protein [Longispora urticae]
MTWRPWWQTIALLGVFGLFLTVSVASLARSRDLDVMLVYVPLGLAALAGIVRAPMRGVTLTAEHLVLRRLTSTQTVPWAEVDRVECATVQDRPFLSIHAPVVHRAPGRDPVDTTVLASYSRALCERRTRALRAYLHSGLR